MSHAFLNYQALFSDQDLDHLSKYDAYLLYKIIYKFASAYVKGFLKWLTNEDNTNTLYSQKLGTKQVKAGPCI